MNKLKMILPGVIIIILMINNTSCKNDNYYPKPRGYFRIKTPPKGYQKIDSNLVYTFDYPEYARLEQDILTQRHNNWLNIRFPEFKGTIHLSYKEVNGNLAKYIDDSHELVNKHIPKANSIKTRKFVNDSNNVFGLVYEIKGTGAATPIQFYLTDSTNHFVRGSLYFDASPNNDSLAPVINFLEKDINRFIESFRWKNK